ncbi:MAG: acetate kinase [Candidatus Omnitrophica bacterium]|nr:acetate kinase [Candidatus Omnitrophota bacterium]MBU4477485.1 acetate kinase [Candidatus Omnitrophota bacterium]MCG2704289.1 acetate kinase [Candidatus Omnitrophota bacterium]
MNILVVNCGSSSIKYQLFQMGKAVSLVSGIAEKIGMDDSYIVHQKDKNTHKIKLALPDYFSAIEKIAGLLTDAQWGALSDKREINAIGHRVVHGGEEFKSSVVIDEKVLDRIKFYSKLAPLHNPPAYNGIKATMKIFPQSRQVAVFDTAFHQTMPEYAFMYGLPYKLYTKYCIRRYGFHGTSHRYVAGAAAEILGKPLQKLKLITCHLGNGCSITAVEYGKSVDTSMGFTPLEGLLMGTRCGDIDPALVGYIAEKEKLTIKQVTELMNRKSGLLGLSGVSNDMRDLMRCAEEGNARAQLAIDVFVYRVKKYIGAYIAAMNGADAIILTAGIGENVVVFKKRLTKELSNVLRDEIKILTIHTEEERLIAIDTFEIVKDADEGSRK